MPFETSAAERAEEGSGHRRPVQPGGCRLSPVAAKWTIPKRSQRATPVLFRQADSLSCRQRRMASRAPVVCRACGAPNQVSGSRSTAPIALAYLLSSAPFRVFGSVERSTTSSGRRRGKGREQRGTARHEVGGSSFLSTGQRQQRQRSAEQPLDDPQGRSVDAHADGDQRKRFHSSPPKGAGRLLFA